MDLFRRRCIIAEYSRDEQRKAIKYNHLVVSCLFFHNLCTLTELVQMLEKNGEAGNTSRKGSLRAFRRLGHASAALPSSSDSAIVCRKVARYFGAKNATYWTCVGHVLKPIVFAAIVMIEQNKLFAFNAVDSLTYVKFSFVKWRNIRRIVFGIHCIYERKPNFGTDLGRCFGVA